MTAALPLAAWSARRASSEHDPLVVVGTMNFGRRTPEAEARRIVDAAFDLGICHFDTANAYVEGEGERILGRALAGRRERAFVTTKVGLARVGGQPSGLLSAGGRSEGLSRENVLRACDESLARLGTDYVDFYFLHVPDAATPIEETLAAVKVLVERGKVRAWGCSNYASWQVLEMITWCDREGLQRPALAQQLYNLLVRQLEIEYLRFAARYGLHTTVYNPLAGGLLAGHHAAGTPPAGSRFDGNPMYQRRYWSERLHRAVDDYRALAAELGMSLVDFAYAWLASRPGVDSVVIGPSSLPHLEAAVRGLARRLDDATLARTDELHRVHQGTDATYARP